MIKLKDILTEFRSGNPSSGKPEKGAYVRDGRDFGKITGFYKKEALVQPIPKIKGVSWVYDLKYLKPSIKKGKQERNVGRPVWTKGR